MTDATLTRRHAFKLAGLAGAAVALRGTDAPAQESAAVAVAADRALPAKALPQGAGFYRTQVGRIEVTIVSDGSFPLAPYPTIGSNAKQEDVEGLLRANFIEPSANMAQVNTLAIRQGDGPVTVVDTGSGKLFGPAAGFARQNLIASGVNPNDVANVVFTHLHPDHVGGALTDDGKLAFPNARHWAHGDEIAFWKNPDFSKSGVPEGMRAGMAAGAQKFITTAGDKLAAFGSGGKAGDSAFGPAYELVPGVNALQTGGHTPGHSALFIQDGGESLVYLTDLIIQSVLVPAHPEWHVGFDTDMQATVDIRRKWFAQLAEKKTRFAGSHLPFPSIGHLKTAGTGYAFVPAPWRWA